MLMVLDAFLPFILFISSPHGIYLKLNITLCPKTCEITLSKKKKRVTSFSSMNVGYQITTLKMLQTLGKTINFQDYQPL